MGRKAGKGRGPGSVAYPCTDVLLRSICGSASAPPRPTRKCSPAAPCGPRCNPPVAAVAVPGARRLVPGAQPQPPHAAQPRGRLVGNGLGHAAQPAFALRKPVLEGMGWAVRVQGSGRFGGLGVGAEGFMGQGRGWHPLPPPQARPAGFGAGAPAGGQGFRGPGLVLQGWGRGRLGCRRRCWASKYENAAWRGTGQARSQEARGNRRRQGSPPAVHTTTA